MSGSLGVDGVVSVVLCAGFWDRCGVLVERMWLQSGMAISVVESSVTWEKLRALSGRCAVIQSGLVL